MKKEKKYENCIKNGGKILKMQLLGLLTPKNFAGKRMDIASQTGKNASVWIKNF